MIGSWCLSHLAEDLGARYVGRDVEFSSVGIDTRLLTGGELFVALRGDYFDGSNFLEAAESRGAVAAVVNDSAPIADCSLPLIFVPDTLRALHQIAGLARRRFSGKIAAVTGSSGKTTTKEMLAAIFSKAGPTVATRRNENNQIGVPLTLLRLAEEHRFAVLELGARRVGDIAELAAIAKPDVALVTNALPAHIASFGSLEGIARGKGELYAEISEDVETLGSDRCAVINIDDPYSDYWVQMARPARCVTFSARTSIANFVARDICMSPEGISFLLHANGQTLEITCPLIGRHNVSNALGAVAVAVSCGVSLEHVSEGLAEVEQIPGRLKVLRDEHGRVVIDDSYNANPSSARAALDVLASYSGARCALVIGDMAELGEAEIEAHRDIGRYARDCGLSGLLACGPLCRHLALAYGPQAIYFEDRGQLIETLLEMMNDFDIVLVKGSRASGMDAVVKALRSPRALYDAALQKGEG